jgi:Na+/H+ antiporter NhaD/arsenite permease-like protein
MEGQITPIILFGLAMIAIAFEFLEKSLIALLGAVLLIAMGYLSPEEAIHAVNFETVILLMAMMILVDISRKSGIFSWLNVRLVGLTRGNPLWIFLLFSLITAVFSAFLDNVTTILIVVPITIELFRGLGRDPKNLILIEIFMANLGGSLTLIGDPTNIIIGSAANLTFNQFLVNLIIPVSISIAVVLGIFTFIKWPQLKPINTKLKQIFLSMMLIRKLEYKFLKMQLSRSFVIKAVGVLVLTLLGFVFQTTLGLPVHVIALLGAVVLAILSTKEAHIHEALQSVEWTTLFFFAGLFVMVEGVEKTGILDTITQLVISSTSDLAVILMIILWSTAIVSMVLENVPFVTVMIPIIIGIQAQFAGEPHLDLLWWALSMGACVGGTGTMIGASSNVVGVGLAKKHGVQISFFQYLKFSLPLTLTCLLIGSAYLLGRFYLT